MTSTTDHTAKVQQIEQQLADLQMQLEKAKQQEQQPQPLKLPEKTWFTNDGLKMHWQWLIDLKSRFGANEFPFPQKAGDLPKAGPGGDLNVR